MIVKGKLTKEEKEVVEEHVEKQLSKKVFTKAEFFRHQFKQHVSTAIIAAFSFLIALSWKDLITSAVGANIKTVTLEQYPYLSSLLSAIIITSIAIIGIALVVWWARKSNTH